MHCTAWLRSPYSMSPLVGCCGIWYSALTLLPSLPAIGMPVAEPCAGSIPAGPKWCAWRAGDMPYSAGGGGTWPLPRGAS